MPGTMGSQLIVLSLRVVMGFVFSVKSLMSKCRNWIKGAKE